jgi:hypothetical protein
MMSDRSEQWVVTVLDALHLVAAALVAVTVPVLVFAVVSRVRVDGATAFRLTRRSFVLRGVVTGLPLAALVLGWALRVPNELDAVSASAMILIAAITWREDDFWAALGVSIVAFALLWSVVILVMSYSFEYPEGAAIWPGGRTLITWGGLSATRSNPHWWWAGACVAVTRFGLPLGLGFALSWLAATGQRLTGIERVAVALGANAVLAVTAVGSVAASVLMVLGFWMGVPVWIVACGLLASGLTLLTVGPGALEAALVTSRAVLLRAHDAGRSTAALAGAVTAFRSAPTDRDLPEHDDDRSGRDKSDWKKSGWRECDWSENDWGNVRGPRALVWFTVGRFQAIRLTHGLLGAGVLLIAVLSPLAFFPYREQMRPARLEHLRSEVGLDMRVATATAGPADTIWLHGTQGELARFDTDRRQVQRLPLDAVTVEAQGTTLIALTDEPAPRVVALDGQDITTLATLPPGTVRDFAIDDSAVYIAGADGALRRYDRPTGALVAEVTGLAAAEVSVYEGELWVFHAPRTEYGGWGTSRRHPVTLALTSDRVGDAWIRDMLFMPEGRAWVYSSLYAAEASTGSERPALLLDADDILYDDGRLFSSRDPDRAWLAQGMGTVERLDADGPVYRTQLPLDVVNGIVETSDGIWAVGDRSVGLSLDRDAADQSYALHWSGPA